MKKSLIGLMLVIVLCFGSVQSVWGLDYYGGLSLKETCNSSNEMFELTCVQFIQGIVTGYNVGIFVAGSGNNPNLRLCVPPNSSAQQWQLVVKKWLNEHPEWLHEAAIFLVIDAIKEAFPCRN